MQKGTVSAYTSGYGSRISVAAASSTRPMSSEPCHCGKRTTQGGADAQAAVDHEQQAKKDRQDDVRHVVRVDDQQSR